MLGALVATPFVSRALLIHDTGSGLAAQDLRGFLSDLGIALLALPLVLLARKIWRWIGVLFVLFWTFFHWLNFEVVADLGSLASVLDLEFLTDETFLAGSAAGVSRPIVLSLLCIVGAVVVWRSRGEWSIRLTLASLTMAGIVLLGQSLWPASQEVADWRQNDFIQANIVYLMRSDTEPSSTARDPRVAMLDLVPEMAADLDGEPILPLPGAAKNILLIMIEGVSGAFIPSLAADQNFHDLFQMPNLGRIATSSLSYSNFVSQNRKTNRGTFTLLCGEPPNLVPGTPKMTQVAMVGGRVCLPQVLHDAGYETVYLQAAPLAFMVKDQFAAKAGYDQIYGLTHFDANRAAAQNKWGIDDLSLFEQSLEVIDDLRSSTKPWFASILTVGTHHPFVFPEDSAEGDAEDIGRRRAAFLYADRAIAWLVEELDRRGVFDDTLVLITSDESRGVLSPDLKKGIGIGNVARRLTQNWGILIAMQPEEKIERIKEPFAQMDIALSVLDYLGLSERAGGFFGRSVFRRYRESRFVPFANTNLLRAGAIDSAGTLLDCRIATDECSKWWTSNKAFFGSDRVRLEWDEATDQTVMEFARRSQAEISATGADYDIELLTQARQPVQERRILHGGPYITLLPGQWLEVDIDVEARGPGREVSFVHYVMQSPDWGIEQTDGEEKWMYFKRFELHDGDRVHLNYTVVPEGSGRMDGVKAASDAVVADGPPFELVFHRAVMRIHVSEDRPEPVFQLRVQDLTRSDKP